MKRFLFVLGWICFALGIIGLVLPIMPTTPFLILSAVLFAKSSDKFYKWLVTHKIFGRFIKDYLKYKAIPMEYKIGYILILWVSFSVSAYFININYIRVIIYIILIIATIKILSIKTKKRYK